MKITDLAIIFILISIPFLITTKIKRDYLHRASEQSIMYNRILDTAIEDAISVYASDERINLELATATFFKTLKVNFEMPDTVLSTTQLSQYIPAMVSIEKDGFSVLAQSEYINESGNKERKLIWQPKETYSYKKDDFIYRFYLDDQLEVYNKDLDQFFKGNYQSLKSNAALVDSILVDEVVFHDIKNREITAKIVKALNYHINEYNRFTQTFGISYEFYLPTIAKEDWDNSISDVSLLVFFQGLPIGNRGNFYNNYAFAGSRLIKSKTYYVVEDLVTGRKTYHNENCEVIESNISTNYEIFRKKFNAAKAGVFPCELCE